MSDSSPDDAVQSGHRRSGVPRESTPRDHRSIHQPNNIEGTPATVEVITARGSARAESEGELAAQTNAEQQTGVIRTDPDGPDTELDPPDTELTSCITDPHEVSVQASAQDRTDLDVPALVTGLRELLGAKLVAYLSGVTQTSTIAAWADGSGTPPEVAIETLQSAHQMATRLVARGVSTQLVQSWFQGQNPAMGDVAPARALREGRDVEDAELP